MYGSEVIIVPILFGLPAALMLVRMLLGYRERQAARGALRPEMGAAIEARLERLEHAIDTIAIEIERLGEGQRFTTKLLAERAPSAAEPARLPERPVTPH